jgi:hypothetical protein
MQLEEAAGVETADTYPASKVRVGKNLVDATATANSKSSFRVSNALYTSTAPSSRSCDLQEEYELAFVRMTGKKPLTPHPGF